MNKIKNFLNQVIYGNCVDIMKQLPDECIDITVTSPPYDNLRRYDGFSFNFKKVAEELFRITKKGGVVVWVVGDATINGSETGTSFKQALFFKEIGFKLYDTMIYGKQNPPPKNHKRYEQAFEYMFILSKGIPKTFNPILEPCKNAGKINKGTMRNSGDDLSYKHGYGKPYKSTKIKSNIWFYPVGSFVSKEKFAFKHPAIFPEQLANDHIISWSNIGDVVLDPFCGSGTTLKMAKLNKRNFIGIDISEEYVQLSKQRVAACNTA